MFVLGKRIALPQHNILRVMNIIIKRLQKCRRDDLITRDFVFFAVPMPLLDPHSCVVSFSWKQHTHSVSVIFWTIKSCCTWCHAAGAVEAGDATTINKTTRFQGKYGARVRFDSFSRERARTFCLMTRDDTTRRPPMTLNRNQFCRHFFPHFRQTSALCSSTLGVPLNPLKKSSSP